ncbi:SDR family NAD(P)-dependent oxidoreductase [Microlunatus ginsengisoli]|uniref:SDR family oxidoreductase n=1 Tax=Microlunatus ginsengisoli TaxID=363863 RepID=A0ABP6ZGU4_9ACTN
MMLEGKTAIVYGGAGSIGGAVARGFAREGARVFLAGRTLESLEVVAEEIRAGGGQAQADVVDALDETAVDAHVARVVATSGGLDISFTAIADNDVQGTPMVEMDVADYLAPIVTNVRSKFITARAAARPMRAQRSGVILYFGGAPNRAPFTDYYIGGVLTAFEAVEAMRRQLASELGRDGIRVVSLRTGGIPESLPADFEGREAIVASMAQDSLLGRTATLADVAAVAAFVASDRAATMTAATVNVSCGALVD